MSAADARIGAVVLAAGLSRRMGAVNKLLVEVDGRALLLHAIDVLIGCRLASVIVVSGHDRERVSAALSGRAVTVVHNPSYALGMGHSLACGIDHLPRRIDGALVCLADMPLLRPEHVRRLLSSFDPARGRSICVPTHGSRRGHPVLFARRHFAELRALRGDEGARGLLERHPASVSEVEMDDPGVVTDVDRPRDLAAVIGEGKAV